MKADAGPFGRFTLGNDVVDHRYFLPIQTHSSRVCASARIRIQQPAAKGRTVVLLSATIHHASLDADAGVAEGVAGLQAMGGSLGVFAGPGGPAIPRTMAVSGNATNWKVVRLELLRTVDGPWKASVFVDGELLLNGVEVAPRETSATAGGEVGFGPLAVSATPPPAPVVVDYADLRFSRQ